MRKVTTINLNSFALQIEEDGYERLGAYLQAAERALAGNPDRTEIMADLEQAIADKCAQAMGSHRNVISAAQIERILQEMGPVADAGQAAAGSAAAGAAEPAGSATGAAMAGAATGSNTAPRRLYRLDEGRMVAGVCTGLAAWAGMDVTWVRVAVVLLTLFSGGLGLIAYLALVLVMPVARTPEELSAAHGQPFNAQELVDRARSRHEQRRSERHARREARQHGRWFHPPASYAAPRPPPGYAARVAGGLLLPVFTLLSAAWFSALAVSLLALWWSSGYVNVTLWPTEGLAQLPHLPQWLAVLAVLAVYVLLALPIGAARRAALYYTNGGQAYGWANAWSGLLWIAVVALVLVAAWLALPLFQQMLYELFGWPGYQDTGATWV